MPLWCQKGTTVRQRIENIPSWVFLALDLFCVASFAHPQPIYWSDIVRSISYSQKAGNRRPVFLLINEEALFDLLHPWPNLLLPWLPTHKSLFAVVSFVVLKYRLKKERTCLPSFPSVKDESLLQAIFHHFPPDVSSWIKWSLFPAQRAAAHIAAACLYDSHGNIKNIDVESLHPLRWADGRLAVAETLDDKTGSAADINVFLKFFYAREIFQTLYLNRPFCLSASCVWTCEGRDWPARQDEPLWSWAWMRGRCVLWAIKVLFIPAPRLPSATGSPCFK